MQQRRQPRWRRSRVTKIWISWKTNEKRNNIDAISYNAKRYSWTHSCIHTKNKNSLRFHPPFVFNKVRLIKCNLSLILRIVTSGKLFNRIHRARSQFPSRNSSRISSSSSRSIVSCLLRKLSTMHLTLPSTVHPFHSCGECGQTWTWRGARKVTHTSGVFFFFWRGNVMWLMWNRRKMRFNQPLCNGKGGERDKAQNEWVIVFRANYYWISGVWWDRSMKRVVFGETIRKNCRGEFWIETNVLCGLGGRSRVRYSFKKVRFVALEM